MSRRQHAAVPPPPHTHVQNSQILEAQEEKEGENTVHKLKLKVEHGTMPDQIFEVEVVDQPKGYQLRSSQQQR